jgi:hypothetical protein
MNTTAAEGNTPTKLTITIPSVRECPWGAITLKNFVARFPVITIATSRTMKISMGNVEVLRGDGDKGLEYYDRAQKREPDNAAVVLAIARVNHDIENCGEVAKLYAQLKQLDPKLAAKYAYLGLKGRGGDARGRGWQRARHDGVGRRVKARCSRRRCPGPRYYWIRFTVPPLSAT